MHFVPVPLDARCKLLSYVESPPFIVSKWLMVDCCALCKCDVSKRTAKAKRLKLYCDSAEATRKRLAYQELLLERRSFGRETWLCHKCKNEIDEYFELIQEINAKREYLVKKLQSVAAFAEPTGRKKTINQVFSISCG